MVTQMTSQTHNLNAVRELMILSMGDPNKAAKQMAAVVDRYTASTRVVRTLANGIQKCEALDKDGLIVHEFYR